MRSILSPLLDKNPKQTDIVAVLWLPADVPPIPINILKLHWSDRKNNPALTCCGSSSG